MKQKLVSIVLVLSMVIGLFTACGKDSEAIAQSNKEVKNFPEAVKAFKETYNAFYDEHRMNGNYMEPEYDCFANVYILGDTPTMLIMDIIQTEQLTEYNTSYIADFYMFEFVDGKVKESAKYLSVSLGRFFTTYIYPLQDKLFMGYYVPKDEPDASSYFEYKVGVFSEYFEEVEKEWYYTEMLVEGEIFDHPNNKTMKEAINELVYDVAEYGDFESYKKSLKYSKFNYMDCDFNPYYWVWAYNTGLSEDGIGGSALLLESGEFDNYCFSHSYGLRAVNFSKYLDYLSTKEVKNNAHLMLQHAKYLETLGRD